MRIIPQGKMSKEILFILTLDFLTVLLQIGSFCPEILASLSVLVALTPAFGREHYFQSGKKKKSNLKVSKTVTRCIHRKHTLYIHNCMYMLILKYLNFINSKDISYINSRLVTRVKG